MFDDFKSFMELARYVVGLEEEKERLQKQLNMCNREKLRYKELFEEESRRNLKATAENSDYEN